MISKNIFNTPLEVALRTLYVLDSGYSNTADLQSIIFLDYFLVHSGDIGGGPASIHPPSPFRSGEMVVKREVLKKGLQLLHKKSLVGVNFGDNGISYEITPKGQAFLKAQSTAYSYLLKERAEWLGFYFRDMDGEKLKIFVSENIKNWGQEFVIK